MKVKEARALFSGVNSQIFLDAACVSLAPQSAKDAVMSFMDLVTTCPARDASEHHIALDAWRSQAYDEVATLFNTDKSKVALIESTTHGLNIAANCIPFEPYDEVIIANTEFLQVAIPFSKKAERGELRLRALDITQTNCVVMEQLADAIGERTRAICISSVQWCTGQKMPMKEIGELCKQKGIWLIVDAVHEAGMLNIDTQERYSDFLIAGGHKWLNSPYGCGLMVMSKRAMELTPDGFGYLSLSEPPGGWGVYFQDPEQTPFRQYDFQNNARSFEIGGTSNYPGAIGLTEALKIVNAIGIQSVEHYVLGLASVLRRSLQEMGVQVISREGSAITVFRVSNDLDKNRALLEYLLNQRIKVSIRYTAGQGGIRVSTHYFNNENDVLALCVAVKTFLTLSDA